MIRAWLLCYAALQVADVLTTELAIGRTGVTEANPIVALMMTYLGGWWWVAKLVSALAGVPMMLASRRWRAWVLGLIASAVVWNLYHCVGGIIK